MTSFPLYDTLYSTVQDRTESVDKAKLVKWIHNLDQDGKNKVYALIRYFSINQTPIQFCEELTFDLDKFPILLQNILYEFVQLHIQHMKDSQKIEKIRKKSRTSNK